MKKEKQVVTVIKILKKYQKSKRKTNLNREARKYTPFQTLISCILSLRSRDEITEKVSKKLFQAAKTPKEILRLPQKRLEKLIYSSGYYRNKAKTIKEIAKHIIKYHNGKVPSKEEHLLAIRGVGRKTANIVLSLAYNKKAIPIDTHCHRIPNRLGLIRTKTPEQTEQELMKILPKEYWNEFNGIFVLFGRTICTPISPKCSVCPIKRYCRKVGVKSSR